MKSVLISIQPKWVEKIASGEKTIEVRKSKPKIETPFKCYIYCTQGDALAYPCLNNPKFNIQRVNNGTLKGRQMTEKERERSDYSYANGKVIGEFVCDKIYKFEGRWFGDYTRPFGTEAMILRESCLTLDELTNYLSLKDGYGWHISDLKIYDKPKELGEFWYIDCKNKKNGCVGCEYKPTCIKNKVKPPQSYCYIENGV